MIRSYSLSPPNGYFSGSCAIDKAIKDGVTSNEAEDGSFCLDFDNLSISSINSDFFDEPVKCAGLTSQVEQERWTAIKYQVKPMEAKENPTNKESLVSRPVEAARYPRSKECSPVDDGDDYIYMHRCHLPISKRGSGFNNDSGYTHVQRTTKNDAVGDSLDKTSCQSGKNSSVYVEAARCPRSKECSPVDDGDDYIYMHRCHLPISKRGSGFNNDSGYTHVQRTTKNDAVGDSLDKTSCQSGKNSSVYGKQVKVVPPNAQAVCNTTSNDSKLTYTAAELQRAALDMNFNSDYFKEYRKKTPLFSQQILIFNNLVFFEELEIKYAPSKKEESLNSIAFSVVKIHKAKPNHKIDLVVQALASVVAENEKVKVVSDGALQVGSSSDIKPYPTSFNASLFELFFRTCGFSTAKYQSPQQVSGVTIDKINERLFKLKRVQELLLFNLLVEHLEVKDALTY